MRQKKTIISKLKNYVENGCTNSPEFEISFWKKQGSRIETLINLGVFDENDFEVISLAFQKLQKKCYEKSDYTNVDKEFQSMCKNFIKLSLKNNQRVDDYLIYFDPESSFYKRVQALLLFRFFDGNKRELQKVFEPLCKLLDEIVTKYPENIEDAYSIYREFIDVLFNSIYFAETRRITFFKENFNEYFSNLLKHDIFQKDGYVNSDFKTFKAEGYPIYTKEYWETYENVAIQEEEYQIQQAKAYEEYYSRLEFQQTLKAEQECEEENKREFMMIAQAKRESEEESRREFMMIAQAEKENEEEYKREFLEIAKAEQENLDEYEELSKESEELTEEYEDLYDEEKRLTDEYKELAEAYKNLLEEYKELKKEKEDMIKTEALAKNVIVSNELEEANNYINKLESEKQSIAEKFTIAAGIIDKHKELISENGTDIPKFILDELELSERRLYYRIGIVGGSKDANKAYNKYIKAHDTIKGIRTKQLELAGDYNEQSKGEFAKKIREWLKYGEKDFIIFLQSDHETLLLNELTENYPTQVTIIGRNANGNNKITKAYDKQKFHGWKFEERFEIALEKYETKLNNDNTN